MKVVFTILEFQHMYHQKKVKFPGLKTAENVKDI